MSKIMNRIKDKTCSHDLYAGSVGNFDPIDYIGCRKCNMKVSDDDGSLYSKLHKEVDWKKESQNKKKVGGGFFIGDIMDHMMKK